MYCPSFIYWFVVGIIVCEVTATGVEEEAELVAKVTANLTKYFAPFDIVNNTVFLFVDLYKILGVDERAGSWTVKLWMYHYYYCPSIQWDPRDYANRTALHLPEGTFWRPDIGTLPFLTNISHLQNQSLLELSPHRFLDK